MSENIIIEEDTKTEVHEMILDMPEGEKGIEEENTTETQNVTNVIFCERKEWIGIEERSSA